MTWPGPSVHVRSARARDGHHEVPPARAEAERDGGRVEQHRVALARPARPGPGTPRAGAPPPSISTDSSIAPGRARTRARTHDRHALPEPGHRRIIIARMHPLERLVNLSALLLDTRRPLTFDEIRDRIHAYGQGDGASASGCSSGTRTPCGRSASRWSSWPPTRGTWRRATASRTRPTTSRPSPFSHDEMWALFVAAHAPGADGEAEIAFQKLASGADTDVLPMPGAGAAHARRRRLGAAPGHRRGRPGPPPHPPLPVPAAAGPGGPAPVDPFALLFRSGSWYAGRHRPGPRGRPFVPALPGPLGRARRRGGVPPPDGFDAASAPGVGSAGRSEARRDGPGRLTPTVAWLVVATTPRRDVVRTRRRTGGSRSTSRRTTGGLRFVGAVVRPGRAGVRAPRAAGRRRARLEALAGGRCLVPERRRRRPAAESRATPRASVRLRRLLAAVPYVIRHPGVRVSELARAVRPGGARAAPGPEPALPVRPAAVRAGRPDRRGDRRRGPGVDPAWPTTSRVRSGSRGPRRCRSTCGGRRCWDARAARDRSDRLRARQDRSVARPRGALAAGRAGRRRASRRGPRAGVASRGCCGPSGRSDRVLLGGRDELTTRDIDPEQLFSADRELVRGGVGPRSGRGADVPRRPHPSSRRPRRAFEPRGLAGADRPLYSRSERDVPVRLRLGPRRGGWPSTTSLKRA